MPVVWTLIGRPSTRAGIAQQAPVLIDEARSGEPAVEAAGDRRGATRVPGQEHERGVVSRLGVQVDLRHARSLRIRGRGCQPGRRLGSVTDDRLEPVRRDRCARLRRGDGAQRRRAADRQLRAGRADRLQERPRRGDRGRLRLGEAGAGRDPRALPGRRHPGGGIGPSPAPEPGAVRRPHLGDRPAGRHRQLRQRPSVLLRVDGPGRCRRAAAGRHPGSAARRPVRRHPGRRGHAQRGAGARLRRRSS